MVRSCLLEFSRVMMMIHTFASSVFCSRICLVSAFEFMIMLLFVVANMASTYAAFILIIVL